MTLRLTERQLRALYAVVRGTNLTSGRFPLAQSRNVQWSVGWREASAETHLISEEMADLEKRMERFLYPEGYDEGVPVEVES